jgi:hypothetical protein
VRGPDRPALEYGTVLIKKALGNQKLGSRTVCDFLGPAYRFEFSWNLAVKLCSYRSSGGA